jgi:hypothetical protein
MDSIRDILKQFNEKHDGNAQKELFDTSNLSKEKVIINNKHKYVSKEYQYYGLRLAGKLGDKKRLTMYIKWAKEKPRVILERAYSFAIDYPSAKDRSRIFIWKVKELEKESKLKKKDVS